MTTQLVSKTGFRFLPHPISDGKSSSSRFLQVNLKVDLICQMVDRQQGYPGSDPKWKTVPRKLMFQSEIGGVWVEFVFVWRSHFWKLFVWSILDTFFLDSIRVVNVSWRLPSLCTSFINHVEYTNAKVNSFGVVFFQKTSFVRVRAVLLGENSFCASPSAGNKFSVEVGTRATAIKTCATVVWNFSRGNTRVVSYYAGLKHKLWAFEQG